MVNIFTQSEETITALLSMNAKNAELLADTTKSVGFYSQLLTVAFCLIILSLIISFFIDRQRNKQIGEIERKILELEAEISRLKQ